MVVLGLPDRLGEAAKLVGEALSHDTIMVDVTPGWPRSAYDGWRDAE